MGANIILAIGLGVIVLIAILGLALHSWNENHDYRKMTGKDDD